MSVNDAITESRLSAYTPCWSSGEYERVPYLRHEADFPFVDVPPPCVEWKTVSFRRLHETGAIFDGCRYFRSQYHAQIRIVIGPYSIMAPAKQNRNRYRGAAGYE